jgi:hypothetical protein
MARSIATLLFVIFIFFFQTSEAQSLQDSVKQTINQLFIAMKNADVRGLDTCFADSAILQTILHTEGKTSVRNEQVNDFSSSIAKLQKGDADEQVTFDVVRIDDELAIVWAPYKFYWKGKFSHCGTDSFQLVRINGVWKIQYLIDTRRKEGCE